MYVVKTETLLIQSKPKINHLHCRLLPSQGGGWQHFKKLLLLLLDSLNSGSNKNLADLTDDEKWLSREYFPLLITESESSPDDALEHIAEVATSITNLFSQ